MRSVDACANGVDREGPRIIRSIIVSERFRLELYPFSYFDPLRKRWVRARYVASLGEIAQRYPQYRIEGPPEIREFERDKRANRAKNALRVIRSTQVSTCRLWQEAEGNYAGARAPHLRSLSGVSVRAPPYPLLPVGGQWPFEGRACRSASYHVKKQFERTQRARMRFELFGEMSETSLCA